MSQKKLLATPMPLALAVMIVIFLFIAALQAPNLDSRIYYTGAEARKFFAELLPAQAASYRLQTIADFFLIAAYTFALVLAMNRLYPRFPLLKWIALAPAVFDLIETACILHILNFGETFPCLDWLGMATALKWCSLAIAIGLISLESLRRAR